MTHPQPRVRRRLLITALTACMAVGGGSVAAQTVSPSPASLAAASPGASTTPGDPTVEDQLAAANAQIAQLTDQNHRLDDLLTAFDDMYDGMEAERQLLLELRKPIPEERKDAEAYFNRLQALAIISDPSRLGQPASRLLETAPIYLDWRDGTYASQTEQDNAFLSSGAAGFGKDFDDLQKAILLTVANRLDSLLNLRDRIR
jgi:hypothetical protein